MRIPFDPIRIARNRVIDWLTEFNSNVQYTVHVNKPPVYLEHTLTHKITEFLLILCEMHRSMIPN